MTLFYFVVVSFLISMAVGLVSIPTIVYIARKKSLFDTPSSRKVHTEEIPRLGGVAFFPATAIAFCFALGLRYAFALDISVLKEGQFLCEIMMLFCGMFLLYLVGLSDDLVGATPGIKFVVQILSAVMLVVSGLYIRDLEGLLGIESLGEIWGVALTILVVVFVVNAFNLIDGVDGLCSGMGVVVLSVFGGWFLYLGEYCYATLVFSMVGILVTFFMYNVLGRELKVFMGDTGSLSLGFIVAFCALKLVGSDDNIELVHSPLSLIIGLLFVPLFDTVRVFFGRIWKGKSPFSPDKTHIHHKLLNLGFSHIQTTTLLILSTILLAIINFILTEFLEININFVVLVDILLGVAVNLFLKGTSKN